MDAITRPNGKPYRPRKIVVEPWEDHWDDRSGAVVFGTHDVEAARVIAAEEITSRWGMPYAVDARVGWWRSGYEGSQGELSWVYDEVRGRAGVFFTASEAPEEKEPAP